MRKLAFSTLAALLACGGHGGKITGKVSVEGGAASGLAVEAIGPTVTAAVTDDSGAFALDGLRDGAYLVRATVPGAEVPVREVLVTVQGSAADQEPTLSFKLAAGHVGGKVVFSDASDGAGVTLTLGGPVARSGLTDATGAFSFDALPPGTYALSAEAANTRERRQALTFTLDSAAPSVTLPDLPFTAVGAVKGTVKDRAMMAAADVEVTVLGTGVRAVTDAAGAFELAEVPAGLRSIVATKPGAVTQTAKVDITVARGANAPVALTLADAMLATGTVSGGVSFFHSGFANLITVSALGSSASASVTAQGSFSLDVPAGDWDIVADAPYYPRQVLGHVTVKEGSTQALPPAHLSIWRRFPEEPQFVVAGMPFGAQASEGDWFILQTQSGMNTWNWVANVKTLARRLFHAGTVAVAFPLLSRSGQQLAYQLPGAVYVVNLSSGKQVAFARGFGGHDFSSDESVYFHSELGSLMRYTLATDARRDFAGNAVYMLSRDRWLVWSAITQDVTLVTPTSETVVISSALMLRVDPIVHAYTGCSATASLCAVKLLPANTSTAVTMQGGTYNIATQGFYGLGTPMKSAGDFAAFNSGTGQKLVKVSDGSLIDLPANTFRIDFNEGATRVFYLSGGPGVVNVREEPVPPTGTVSPVATLRSLAEPSGWVSPTRLVMFDESTGAARRLEVKSGVLSADTNYVAGSGALLPPLAHWARSSDMKRAALVADSTVKALDIVYPGMGVTAGAGTEGPGKPGRWGAISDNVVSGFKGAYVIDGVADTMRVLSQFRVNANGLTSAHSWSATHAFSSEIGSMTWTTDQFIVAAEPGIAAAGGIPRPTGTWFISQESVSPPRGGAVIADVPYP